MSTHQLSILGWQTIPDASGRAFFESYPVKATNDVFKHLVLTLNKPGTNEAHGVYGVFTVPQNYVGTAVIIAVWTSTVTANTVRYDFDYRAIGGDDAESLDQATFQESVTATDTAPTATDRRMTTTLDITDANLAAGDTVEFFFTREEVDAGTELDGAVTVHELLFQYVDA